MTEKPHKAIVVVGTNASGKSGLAIRLAKKFGGEIISADSRQVYRDLDIATGKVTKEEMDGVPHYLIDVADPKNKYSAADFARDGLKALKRIIDNDNIPIIAGGTGFYIQALLHPETLPAIPSNDKLREELEKQSVEELFEQLQTSDPERAEDLKSKNEQGNKRRVVRAVEISLTDPEMFSETSHITGIPLEVLWIGIAWEKDALSARIHERTISRIEDGMIEEARELHKNGITFERMEELGLEYKHLADFLRDKITKDELIENIELGDRQYAKRQRTWFKRNKKINWFDGDNLGSVESLVKEFLAS